MTRKCQKCGAEIGHNHGAAKLCPPCRHVHDRKRMERYRRTLGPAVRVLPYPKYLLSYLCDFYRDNGRAEMIARIYRRQTGWHIPVSSGRHTDMSWAGTRKSSRGRKPRENYAT